MADFSAAINHDVRRLLGSLELRTMRYKIINRKKYYATAAGDLVTRMFFDVFSLGRPSEPIDRSAIKSILIIRTAYLGDVVMTLPIFKPLKENFADARVALLTSPLAGDLVDKNPYVDRIIRFSPFWFYPASKWDYCRLMRELAGDRFDLIIEARGDIREIFLLVRPLDAKYKVSYGVGGGAHFLTHVVPYPGIKHKVEYHLDLVRYLGCHWNTDEWQIYLDDDEKQNVRRLLIAQRIQTPYICVHPGARVPLKRWPLEKCARLYDQLTKNLAEPLVLLGSLDEVQLVEDIARRMRHKPVVLAGRLTIRQLAGVLAESSLLVCNDSGPMHIAAAMRTPVVAIFGPSKSNETGPYGTRHQIVEKDFACRYGCDESSCRHARHHACMQDIQVEDVYGAALRLREDNSGSPPIDLGSCP